MFDVFTVNSSGMEAQRIRLNLISSNLANVETTRTAEGGPYRRKDLILDSVKVGSFKDLIAGTMGGKGGSGDLEGVRISQIIEDDRPFKMVFNPAHPDADENGFVAMPNVNVVEEMVNMITASRSYEANIKAFQASREMIQKAIDISS